MLIPDSFPIPRLARGGGRDLGGGVGRPGWFCFDTATPMVAGSFTAALAAADAALTAADLVAAGAPAAYALCRPPGHHAGPGYYGGFCLLNNAAIAARSLATGWAGWRSWTSTSTTATAPRTCSGRTPRCCTCRCTATRPATTPTSPGPPTRPAAGPGRAPTATCPCPTAPATTPTWLPWARRWPWWPASTRRPWSCRPASTPSPDDPIGAFQVTTGGFRRIGAALAAAGRPTVVVQEGGYAVEALGANAVALLRGVQEAG